MHIRGVSFAPKGAPTSEIGALDDVYRGPDFSELDGTLQEAFHQYLEER